MIKSFKDSQGFRKYTSNDDFENGALGTKLKVIKTNAHIYHYTYFRHPILISKKASYFHRFWHDDAWMKDIPKEDLFDFNKVDKLEQFKGSDPEITAQTIAQKNWNFEYDPTQSNMKWKDRIIHIF